MKNKEYIYKITHISAAYCPKVANFGSFDSIARYVNNLMYVFMNINGNSRNWRKDGENLKGYTYKITHILTAYFLRVTTLVPYQQH